MTGLGEKTIERICPVPVQGGERVVLCDSFVTAARCTIEPGKETAIAFDDQRCVLVRVSSGCGSIVVADASECRGMLPCLHFERGDLFLIPPGIRYAVRSEGSEPVAYSEHSIAPDVALI